MAYLNSIMSGGSVHVLPEADSEAFFRAIEGGTVTYASASFAILRECLQRLDAGRGLARAAIRVPMPPLAPGAG
jgi:hypothetical protein